MDPSWGITEDFKYTVWPLAEKVDGWMSKEELLTLYTLARELHDHAVVVEIGAWVGRSSLTLASASQVQVFCVDPWDCSGDEAYLGHDFEPLAEWKKNMEKAGVSPTPLVGTSEHVNKTWTSPIDMLFIDGDHSYAAVKKDVELWTPFLKVGGILAMDDVMIQSTNKDPRWEGPGKVAEELIIPSDEWSAPVVIGKLLLTKRRGRIWTPQISLG